WTLRPRDRQPFVPQIADHGGGNPCRLHERRPVAAPAVDADPIRLSAPRPFDRDVARELACAAGADTVDRHALPLDPRRAPDGAREDDVDRVRLPRRERPVRRGTRRGPVDQVAAAQAARAEDAAGEGELAVWRPGNERRADDAPPGADAGR